MAEPPKRKPAILPPTTPIIVPATSSAIPPIGKSPPFLQGIRPMDVSNELKNATPEQVKMLQAARNGGFALWAQYSGIEVDNHKFDFDKHRYLLPIYLDMHHDVSLIKAAQMGATVYQLLFLIWWARHNSVKCGMYFPTKDDVGRLSKDRMAPMLQSNAEMASYISDAEDGTTDTIGLKQIQNITGRKSSIYLLYLGGKASKDSVPLDVVVFDEVRLVAPKDIDQALERVSHSEYKIKRYMSTAGFPHRDIHARFMRGNQMTWHVKCNCLDGFIPSECFPDCMVDTGKEVYLRCPRCQMRIHDPQLGQYVAHNPKAEAHSYSISQLISKFISPKEIWDSYLNTTNKKEFYNAKLGRPYVDLENQPVTEEVLLSCVNEDKRWAYQQGAGKDIKQANAMGVDQMGGYNYVTIGKRDPNGKKTITHLEIIEQQNPIYRGPKGEVYSPFKRLYELMKEFNVACCVIDALPNYNEAADFARAFPGRVFLAHYGEAGVDIVKWHDKLKMREQIKRGSKEIKLKWQVTMHRYMSLDYALQEFVEGNVDVPHPDALVQMVRNTESGRFEAEPICRERFFPMLSSLVRHQKDIEDTSGNDTGKSKMEWIYTDGDPHFAHSWNYCNVAIERMRRASIFVMA